MNGPLSCGVRYEVFRRSGQCMPPGSRRGVTWGGLRQERVLLHVVFGVLTAKFVHPHQTNLTQAVVRAYDARATKPFCLSRLIFDGCSRLAWAVGK